MLTVLWGVTSAACGAVAFYLLSRNRGMRSRLDLLEDRLTTPQPGARLPWHGAFAGFLAGNSFEAGNIVGAIAWADEYGMAGCRLAPDDIVVNVGAHIGAFSYLCYVLGSLEIHAWKPRPATSTSSVVISIASGDRIAPGGGVAQPTTGAGTSAFRSERGKHGRGLGDGGRKARGSQPPDR